MNGGNEVCEAKNRFERMQNGFAKGLIGGINDKNGVSRTIEFSILSP
jgi:hypothetical protein